MSLTVPFLNCCPTMLNYNHFGYIWPMKVRVWCINNGQGENDKKIGEDDI